MQSLLGTELFYAAVVAAVLSAGSGAVADTEPSKQASRDANLPKVLIIGDSISIGYTEPVKRLLRGRADVRRVNANCGPTQYGLQHLKEWLGDEHWDVVHFNWGIWDMHQMEGDNIVAGGSRIRTPLPQYEQNLRKLVGMLRATGAKLVWASITPLDQPTDPAKYGANAFVAEDVVKYNAVAERIMAENGIPVSDLYTLVYARRYELRTADSVHFTDEGSRVLAREVAINIQRAINALQWEQRGCR